MSIDDRFEGWTIKDAFRRTGNAQAVVAWVKAEKALRECGKVGRHYRYAGVFTDSEVERAAAGAREHQRKRQGLIEARDAACVAVRSPLMRLLKTGKLVALGRRGSPTAEQQSIPASAWKELRIIKLDRSTVEERTEERLKVHGVRIFAALMARNAPERLVGLSLVQAFETFVLRDPELEAIVRASGAEEFGEGLDFNWCLPLDLARYPTFEDVVRNQCSFWSSVRFSGPSSPKACRVFWQRWTRLLGLCQRASVAARAMHESSGNIILIDAAQWSKPNGWIDVRSGDLLERVGEKFTLRWSGLSFAAQGSMRQTEFHGKPVAYDDLRSATEGVRSSATSVASAERQLVGAVSAQDRKVAPRRRPVAAAVAEALKAAKLDRGPRRHSYKAIAGIIAPSMESPPQSESEMAALTKAVQRYYDGLGSQRGE